MDVNALRSARKKMFNSAQGLADVLGVNRVTVANWETGKSLPSSEMLHRIAEVLHVSVSYLLGESESPAAVDQEFRISPYVALLDTAREDAPFLSSEQKEEAIEIVKNAITEIVIAEQEIRDRDMIYKTPWDSYLYARTHVPGIPNDAKPLKGRRSDESDKHPFKLRPYAEIQDLARRDAKLFNRKDVQSVTREQLREALGYLEKALKALWTVR